MPRAARKKSETDIYHVMLRGIGKQNIFEDNRDKEKFLRILSDCKEKSGFSLFAYCLMNNHVHLLLKVNAEPLEVIFKRIGSNYVYWYNTRYERVGHLFQDRFKSEPVENDSYLATVIRYIHYNPLKGGLSNDLRYKYSSYLDYETGASTGLTDLEEPLFIFGREDLLAFHALGCEDQCLEIAEAQNHPITEEAAASLVHKYSKTDSIAAFAKLPQQVQAAAIYKAHVRGASIRQLVRVTGVPKGIIEKWLK